MVMWHKTYHMVMWPELEVGLGVIHVKRPVERGCCQEAPCLYVYMCICICVYVCICICMYMCICICVYVCICVCVYVCICICVYVHVWICICVYVHVCICICVYVYKFTYANIYKNTLMHVTRIRLVCMCSCVCMLPGSTLFLCSHSFLFGHVTYQMMMMPHIKW